MIEEQGFRLDTVPNAVTIGGANGRTDGAQRLVLVRADMDEAAMVKTLIHEAAHVLLHTTPPGMYLPRPLKEVEAESVAYVVASVHGMPTDDYSFPYVAAWAGEDGANAVQATQARVATAARQLIDASPAAHTTGGKVPGVQAAIAAAQQRRSELEVRLAPAVRARASRGGGVMPRLPADPDRNPTSSHNCPVPRPGGRASRAPPRESVHRARLARSPRTVDDAHVATPTRRLPRALQESS